ncbi:hypothetical protein HK101_006971 [Irineochytrium annulatum]|nr:hypothetical protein HK101_006971 [Irineochytrium annulatum]
MRHHDPHGHAHVHAHGHAHGHHGKPHPHAHAQPGEQCSGSFGWGRRHHLQNPQNQAIQPNLHEKAAGAGFEIKVVEKENVAGKGAVKRTSSLPPRYEIGSNL